MMFLPCGLFRAATGMLRTVIGCMCFLLLGGPIMIIVGITMIVAPNNREAQVQAYNTAITNFNTDVFSSWTGTIGGFTAQQETLPIVVDGDTDGVNSGQSSVLTANVGTMSTVSLNFNMLNSFSRNVQYTKTTSVSVSCSSRYSNINELCTQNDMEQKCTDQYGSTATYSGPECYENHGSCGWCLYTSYLQSYCVVVEPSTGTTMWQQSSSKQSCRHPFTSSSQVYASTSVPDVPFFVYASTDPYLVLQEQTKGSDNFGLTRAKQTGIGVGLAASGAFLTVGVCVGLCLVGRMISNRNQKEQSTTLALPIAQDPYMPTPNYAQPHNGYCPPPGSYGQPGYAQPQPGYAQPQPGYGQSQPGYGQPQPGNAQSQPGYGQPQPGYGQPQPGYGQPQPGYTQPQPVYGQPISSYGQPQPVFSQPKCGFDL